MDTEKLENWLWIIGGAMLFMVGVVWAMPWLDPTRNMSLDGHQVKTVMPSSAANRAQIALIQASNKYPIVNAAGVLAMVNHESAGTFSTKIRPRRRNGKYIGSATGLCQMIARTRVLYGLPFSTTAMQKVSPENQAKACVKLRRNQIIALSRSLGRMPTDGELYLAHFLGTKGAERFFAKPRRMAIAKALPAKVIRANVFLRRLGTSGGVRRWAERKMRANKIKVARYIKGQPVVAGWVAAAENTNTDDPSLWVNKRSKFSERFSFEYVSVR